MTENSSEQAALAVKHVRWSDLPVEAVNEKLSRQFVVGSETMVARMSISKDCVIPLHSHHNEQVSYILSGALRFTVGDQEITVAAGELLCIPPHVPHAAIALEDTVDVDFFVPPRQDWLDGADAYLR